MAIFHTYIDDSTPGGEDVVAGIGSDTLYGVSASQDFKVSGISTFSGTTEFEKVKFLKDSTGDIGNSGQLLSSTGSGIDWINSNTTTVNAASNVAVNEDATDASQWLTFVGAKSGNNPIRVDDGLKYNPSSNRLFVKYVSSTSGNLELQAVAGANGIVIKDNNAVELYYDGSATWKLATKTDGVEISDNLYLADNVKLKFGTNNDLHISHTNDLSGQDDSNGDSVLDGDNWCSYIKETGTGPLVFKSNGGPSTGAYHFYDTGWRPILKLFSGTNARAALYHAGAEKLITSTTGITVTGTVAATTFSGALTGNASGSSGSCTGNAAGLTGTPDIEVTDIDIAGTLTDKNDITGVSGQVLTSTQTGVAWANAGTLAAGAAAEVAVSNEATDASCFPVFAIKATGADIALKSNAGLKFDSATVALEAGSFVKTSGTSSEFLKADGSVDTSTYLTSQVQSDWNSSTAPAAILNKPTLFSGAYGDLTGKPTLVTAFTGLSDTPANYTSQASKFVAVKSDGTGLEFVNNPNTDNQRAIHDTPSNGSTAISISSNWAYDHKELEGNSAHVPAAGTGNSGKFLANDGSWQTPSYTTNTNTTYELMCTQDSNGGNSSDNVDPYLFLHASSGTDDSVKIVGGTNVNVTRDGDGQLTISSLLSTLSATLSGTSAQTVDTVALNAFNVLEYSMYISHSSGMQAQKLLVMCDGTNHHHTEYAVMYSASLLGTFSTSTSGSNVLVRFTPANSGTTTVKFVNLSHLH